jgi:hypothetical protein
MEYADGRSVGEIIERRRNIILEGADVVTAKGYTMVPNHALESNKLSPGAKLAYAMLLKYAWQDDFCFPGQERLAKDMRVSDRSVRTYLQELEAQKFITFKQQGQGRPNFYVLKMRASGTARKNFLVKTGKKWQS